MTSMPSLAPAAAAVASSRSSSNPKPRPLSSSRSIYRSHRHHCPSPLSEHLRPTRPVRTLLACAVGGSDAASLRTRHSRLALAPAGSAVEVIGREVRLAAVKGLVSVAVREARLTNAGALTSGTRPQDHVIVGADRAALTTVMWVCLEIAFTAVT